MAVYIVLIKRLLTVYISGKVLPKMTVQKKIYIYNLKQHASQKLQQQQQQQSCKAVTVGHCWIGRWSLSLCGTPTCKFVVRPSNSKPPADTHAHTVPLTHRFSHGHGYLSVNVNSSAPMDRSTHACQLLELSCHIKIVPQEAGQQQQSACAATCGKHVRTTHWSFANNQ